jgi:hypothetical protein
VVGDSDDDSVRYEARNRGKGTDPTDHRESQYDFDPETGEVKVKQRRCKAHPGEFARYLCKDHEDGKILCPKCLINHKVCNFAPMGSQLSHECKAKFRTLITSANVRYNTSSTVLRKVD